MSALIIVTIPFVIAFVVQVSSSQVRNFAGRRWRINRTSQNPLGIKFEEEVLDLAEETYVIMTTFTSNLLTFATCFSVTLMANIAWLSAIVLGVFALPLVFWALKWQFISHKEMRARPGKIMKALGIASVVIQAGISIYVVCVGGLK